MKFIKNILFLSIFSTICFSAKFQKILSGENYTKIRFKQIEIDQKTEIENSSFFYQYNGEISINLDSFDYEIENGESSSIPNPHIQIIEFGYIRGFKIFKIEISSSSEIENSKIKFDNIEFTIEELNFNIDEIDSRIHSPIFEKLAEQLSINSLREVNLNYQKPAILYITGGSSGSNPNFQELKNWRMKKGFEVYEVSTSSIGSSNVSDVKNYIQEAYNSFDPAPEYVCLIGDDGGEFNIDSFTEFHSGYNGEGDHPYSQLNGNDILPEVLIGRISVRTYDELSTVIQKILFYEKGYNFEIPEFDNSWIEKAALIGDPYPSGNSTIITNQYIEETMLNSGFAEIYTNYGENDIDTWMVDVINDGVSFLNYRGWWGVSGFSQDEVNSLTNSLKLPFATLITCGTGSFAEHDNSLVEALVRSGTQNNPIGAIAAIGTATSGTHTAYNNIVDMGIYHGIFALERHTAGEALAYGKLALLNTYPENPNNIVTIFSHWNNLIGDPSLQLWTQTPKHVNIDFSNPLNSGSHTLKAGSHSYNIYITDENNNPIENARLVLMINGNNEILNEVTNENGFINTNITIGYGPVQIFVTGKNIIPLEQELIIEEDLYGIYVDLDNILFNDSNDNDVQILIPNEEYSIHFPCVNIGSEYSGELSTYLFSAHPEISIYQNTLIIPGITQFSEINVGPFPFSLTSNFYNGEQLPLIFILEDENQNSWSSIYNLTVNSYHPQLFYNDENGIINKGEFKENFNFRVRNNGILPITNLKAEILFSGNELEFHSGILDLQNLLPNGEVVSPGFPLYASNLNLNGITVNVPVRLFNDNGYDQTEYFQVQIGNIQQADPIGPDNYGYFIFGNEDLEIQDEFEYDWIEIDPYYGGEGTNLNLIDEGNGDGLQQNTTAIIELPFEFNFYGESYTNITVSSNGWIAFGETQLTSFRNYPIPGPGGPSAMISAFWDDLKAENNTCEDGFIADCSNDLDCCSIEWIGDGWEDCVDQAYGCDLSCYAEEDDDCNGNNQPINGKELSGYIPYFRSDNGGAVIYYHDVDHNQVIIEWSDMRTYLQNDEEDFQIILKPFPEDDGEIIINYKTFNNTSIGDYESQTPLHGQFATIGIENKAQTDGLQYTFNNQYSNGARPLANQSSILISKYYNPYDYMIGDLNYDSQINVLDIIYIVSIIMGYIETTPQLDEIGDLNNDYNLNVNDIVILVNFILNN